MYIKARRFRKQAFSAIIIELFIIFRKLKKSDDQNIEKCHERFRFGFLGNFG